MKTLCKYACLLLASPTALLGGLVLVSVFSLASALTAEVVFGLEPCILCVYQRTPFMIVIFIGAPALMLRRHMVIARGAIGLSGIALLANSLIATFHSGVERKWWRSPFESCTVSFDSGDTQNLLENILSAPSARCDEIPWADPILGLSMANYNAIMCAGLFAVCALALVRQCRAGSSCP